MRIARSGHETAIFAMDGDAFSTLHARILAILPTVNISCECSDGLERQFSSVDELLHFGNPSSAAITSMTIRGVGKDRDDRFTLSLDSKDTRNVWISIDASEEVGLALNSLARSTLDSMRPWYSPVAKADWTTVAFVVWMLSYVGIVAVAIVRQGISNIPWDRLDSAKFTLIDAFRGMFLGLIPIGAGVVLNILRDRYFPKGSFMIGDGKARSARLEVVRTLVIVGFVISMASSLVMAALL
jgi:hypothetical protein